MIDGDHEVFVLTDQGWHSMGRAGSAICSHRIDLLGRQVRTRSRLALFAHYTLRFLKSGQKARSVSAKKGDLPNRDGG